MSTENQAQQPSNEIDLFDLLKKIYTGCCSILRFVFKFLLRNILWLVIAAILGILFSYVVSNKSKKYYTSTVLLLSKNVSCDVIISQIDALNDLLASKGYKTLAEILKLPDTAFEEVKSIKALYAIDIDRDKRPDYADLQEGVRMNPKDTTEKRMHDYFYLKLEVFSEKAFQNVASSLKSYVKTNTFLQEENSLAVEQKQRMLSEVKKQVALLDSFQRVEYFEKSKIGAQQFVISDHQNNLYHNDYIALITQQQKIEKDLMLYSNLITVVQDFPPLSQPDNRISVYLKKYVPVFILLGLLCAVLWAYRKQLWAYVREKN